jgi:hypothetical protein
MRDPKKKGAEWEAIRRRYLSFATSNSTRWHKSTGTSAALNHKNKVAANLSAMFAVLQLYNLGIAALAQRNAGPKSSKQMFCITIQCLSNFGISIISI